MYQRFQHLDLPGAGKFITFALLGFLVGALLAGPGVVSLPLVGEVAGEIIGGAALLVGTLAFALRGRGDESCDCC